MIISASHKLVQFMRQGEGQKKTSITAPGCLHACLTSDQCKKCKLLCNKNIFFFLNSVGIGSFQKWNIFSEIKAIQNYSVVQTTGASVILLSNCMVIKLIIALKYYQIKILHSEVTAAGTRTSVKAPAAPRRTMHVPAPGTLECLSRTHLRHSSHPTQEVKKWKLSERRLQFTSCWFWAY